MSYGYLLPLTFVFGSISWRFLLATLYFPSFKYMSTVNLMKPLVAVHLFRYISFSLLIPGLTTAGQILPQSHIYRLAGGDVLCSLLAMLTLFLMHRKSKYKFWAAGLLTVVGLTDLLLATIFDMPLFFENIGVLDTRLFSVLTTYVPLVFVSHVTIAKMLLDIIRGKEVKGIVQEIEGK